MTTIVLTGDGLRAEDVVAVARQDSTVTVSPSAIAAMEASALS